MNVELTNLAEDFTRQADRLQNVDPNGRSSYTLGMRHGLRLAARQARDTAQAVEDERRRKYDALDFTDLPINVDTPYEWAHVVKFARHVLAATRNAS
jgi:hypothetical protein